jgi:ATP-dependent DNA helicase RecG
MDIEAIKGVGPKSAEQLRLAGLGTPRKIIEFLPRKYDDFNNLENIADIKPGNITVQASVDSISVKQVRRGMTITTATLSDNTGKINAVWFNQPYRKNQLTSAGKTKSTYFFSGSFEFSYGKYQLLNPSAEKVSDITTQTGRILPTYRALKGLKSQLIRKVLLELKPAITMLKETLPADIIKKYGLVSRSNAYLGVHFPKTREDMLAAKRRLGFEEILSLLIASQLNRRQNNQLKSTPVRFIESEVQAFVKSLPFSLTDDQRRASWDIIKDMTLEAPMNRLVQGDVGTGKTIVAAIAAFLTIRNGYQVAIMAPTEILARQHAETLDGLFRNFNIKVGLLVGGVKKGGREQLLENISSGSIDLVVGTHALIQEGVKFSKLNLVIIDEQHRFGVAQRQKLLQKVELTPHLLTMTATPIPRSLALTLYGDLDMTIIRNKPAGRRDIITRLISPTSRRQIEQAIDDELAKGHQAYVVCPLIDESENEQKSAEAEYKRLSGGVFSHRRIGLLHGKLKPAEKDVVLNQFVNRKIDIMVSTTVVEVGVDVPNATVILIESADRFGLSQLHQLRGRVGRSDHQSYCYLMLMDNLKPSARLKEIEKSTDGFYLSERDLELRGPGEIYGKAQHGTLNLQVASLGDTELISEAQKAASWCVEKIKLNEYRELYEQVQYYQRLTVLN